MDGAKTENRLVVIGILFGIIAALIWGVFPVVTQKSIEHNLSAYDIAALRFMVAGPLLIPVLWRLKLTGITWLGAILLTCGAGAPYLLLAITGLEYAPAAHFGAITPSSMLIFTAIGSWLWLGDKFTLKRVFGTLIIVLGILVISWEGLQSVRGDEWIGDLIFVIAGLFWAAYTLALRHWNISPIHAIALLSVVSMMLYLPGYFMFATSGLFVAPLADVIFQAVFQGIIAVFVALLLYSKAVAILGAAKGALFGALVPTVALLLAIPILGESPTGIQVLGVILVTFGMLLALGLFAEKRSLQKKVIG